MQSSVLELSWTSAESTGSTFCPIDLNPLSEYIDIVVGSDSRIKTRSKLRVMDMLDL
jgi:hypothetical protein